jgi:hypothetical protein
MMFRLKVYVRFAQFYVTYLYKFFKLCMRAALWGIYIDKSIKVREERLADYKERMRGSILKYELEELESLESEFRKDLYKENL